MGSDAVEDADVVISVVIGQGGTGEDALIGGVISIRVVITETLRDTALVTVIREGVLTGKQALPCSVVGVVEIGGSPRAEGSTGTVDWLSKICPRAFVQTHPASRTGIVETKSTSRSRTDCHADTGRVIAIPHEARRNADRRVVISESAETAPEGTEVRGVVGRVGGITAGGPTLPYLRVAVEESGHVDVEVEGLALRHAGLPGHVPEV
jgi:hypothetical protein